MVVLGAMLYVITYGCGVCYAYGCAIQRDRYCGRAWSADGRKVEENDQAGRMFAGAVLLTSNVAARILVDNVSASVAYSIDAAILGTIRKRSAMFTARNSPDILTS